MGGASVRVICGPTAAGKSSLAMALAEQHDIVILSADSRQVYRGFDIGTAKPSPAEQARVPHRGIDVVDPLTRYSAARWAADARVWIGESEEMRRAPVVVGGTGFYVRALAEPLFEEPALDERRRSALQAELERMGAAELRRWCERLDPERAPLGRAQLLRAVQIALLTGRPISEWHRRAARAGGVRVRYLVLDPKEDLERRIVERTNAMVAAGWEEEVRLLAERVPADAPAWKATGYSVIRDMVAGRLARDSALARIVIDTRRYAKRQRTWFRHQLPEADVTRVDSRARDLPARAEQWWHGEDAR